MMNYADEFKEYLNRAGLDYEEREWPGVITVITLKKHLVFNGLILKIDFAFRYNKDIVHVEVGFIDSDGDDYYEDYDVISCCRDKYEKGCAYLNKLNYRHKNWKFYMRGYYDPENLEIYDGCIYASYYARIGEGYHFGILIKEVTDFISAVNWNGFRNVLKGMNE